MSLVDKPEARREHKPVLLQEMLQALAPKDHALYVDATFGGGGYTRAILEAANCHVIAVDRDPEALTRAYSLKEHYPERLRVLSGVFGNLSALLKEEKVSEIQGIVFDLGASSYQLDMPERGFSFDKEGPLDMRMGKEGISAADVVNTYTAEKLADIFFYYGEEPKARQVAKTIVEARQYQPFHTTVQLAALIKKTVGQKSRAHHPATLTFQALRIYVNDELKELYQALMGCPSFLQQGGRVVVVSFHSLEDRLVKNFFQGQLNIGAADKRKSVMVNSRRQVISFLKPLYNKVIKASNKEIQENPRARSARLRVAVYQGGEQSL